LEHKMSVHKATSEVHYRVISTTEALLSLLVSVSWAWRHTVAGFTEL
jgi:hypothetical protein